MEFYQLLTSQVKLEKCKCGNIIILADIMWRYVNQFQRHGTPKWRTLLQGLIVFQWVHCSYLYTGSSFMQEK